MDIGDFIGIMENTMEIIILWGLGFGVLGFGVQGSIIPRPTQWGLCRDTGKEMECTSRG